MGNYLMPIESWASQVLQEREKNPMMAMYRTPFAVLSSPAIVTKGNATELTSTDSKRRYEEIKKCISGKSGEIQYKGCIISNNINDLSLSYSLNETPVGLDFDGKVIKVQNETGRKVSTPIITSIDVDTEEANNTLKTTRISITCFTLKQLELFELFFLRPGMNVLIEWGDSSLLKRNIFKTGDIKYDNKTLIPYSDVSEALFVNKHKKFEEYCDKFSEIYFPSSNELSEIFVNIRKSLGSYEYCAGIVSGFSYNITSEGTFEVNLEIFQTNQISLATPKGNANKSSSKTNNRTRSTQVKPDSTTIAEAIIYDFNIDTENPKDLSKYENDWFNFIKKNDKQIDTYSSSDAYVSLRFIAKYLMNLATISTDDRNYKFNLPDIYKIDGKKEDIVPTQSSPYLISSTNDILIPNKNLVEFKPNTSSTNAKDDTVIPVTGSKVDASINGKTFNMDGKKVTYELSGQKEVDLTKENPKIGNALNIFVRYELVVQKWNASYTRAEFMTKILEVINNNLYGLAKLVLMPVESGKPATIVDYKFSPDSYKTLINTNTEIYRFKPTTINSIVKSFNFNFQMDNLIAGNMMFNSSAKIRQAIADEKAPEKKLTDEIATSIQSYKSYDYSTFANADGWYSFNNVEKQRQEKLWTNMVDDNKTNDKTIDVDIKTTKTNPPNGSDVIKNNGISFKLKQSKNPVMLIYRDQKLIQSKIKPAEIQKSVLSAIDVSVTIDGFSGFRAGQFFRCDGVPEIFNQIGAFQIMNIKHSLTPDDGWTTTIEASFRYGLSD